MKFGVETIHLAAQRGIGALSFDLAGKMAAGEDVRRRLA